MKFIRIIVIVVFCLSAAIFGAAQVREISSADATVPEITSDRDVLEISCDYTEEQLVEGLTAYDEKDGDLTSQIIAGSFSRFITKGECNINYVVFDSANQPATLTRRVVFTDYHSPRFTLTQPLVYEEGEGSYNTSMERIGASDMLDGDLNDWITQTDTDLNYSREGDYHMTVEVTNSFGDTSTLAMPVHVVKEGAQNINIELESYIVYIEPGESLSPRSFVSGVYDSRGNQLDSDILEISDDIDEETAGCYEIHYHADDGEGNTGDMWLTVVVQE